MYRGLRVIGIAPALDEGRRIGGVVAGCRGSVLDEMVVVDDGSRDDTAAVARAEGATVLSHPRPRGVGASLRTGYEWAHARGFDVAVTMAGNGKDDAGEIPRLLDPIADGRAVFVQGSRFLAGGGYSNMPLYRRLATRVHPLLFRLVSGRRVTESTNGFRAFRLALLDDPRLDLSDPGLDRYELEVWLYLQVVRLGHPTAEVPVTKRYPREGRVVTKMEPFTDWWRMLRPFWLVLRRRRSGGSRPGPGPA